MSYLDEILSSAQGGHLVANLAQRYGLTDEQMDHAVKALAPALEIALSKAAEEPALFEKLIDALASPERQAAFYRPDAALADESVDQSRAFLAELFGSPAAAGQVVQVAARESGLRPDILSQLLPVLASVLIGGLFKNVSNQGLGGILGQLVNSGALGSILEQMLGGGGAPRQPTPMPRPRDGGLGGGGLGGGGLGGLLGGILGSLLGGGRRPPPGGGPYGDPMGGPGGGFGRRGPLDGEPESGGPAGLPEGLDQASVQQAIEEIKKTLQIGRGESAKPGGQSDLESLIGQIFGKR